MRKTKKPARQYINKNPIEQLLGGFDQILGIPDSKEKQTKNQERLMIEGQEISLAEFQEKNSEEKREIEAGIDYSREIVHMGENAATKEDQNLETQLREIITEIKKLADSSRELQTQFKEIAVEQHVVKPGKYHKSFFTWILSMIQTARMKVEDSGAWLAAIHSKKKQRQYGAMAKKHGTTFTLSNERNVATQVG